MTNKPMLSVDRELLERITRPQLKRRDETVRRRAITELRALLDKEVDGDSHAPKHQGEPVAEVEREFDNSPAHVHLYQDLPDGTKLYAEQPAPVADHTQCEECKGWGYHENHYEGGGTEYGECGGSGKAPVEQLSADTVVCRRYQLEQHPGQNFYHYDLEPVYGSVPVTVSELITMVESAPAAVVMTDKQILEAMRQSLTDADGGYVFDTAKDDVIDAARALLAEAARLNGVKP